jgi:hypothetical protein
MKDEEMEKLLKEMILEKAILYDEIKTKLLTGEAIDQLLKGEITSVMLQAVFSHYEAMDELALIKRDLSSMCYQLNRSRNRIPDNTKWESSYNYATQAVQIGDVVHSFLGAANFNRNILCPFHEDKSPSLKVYLKTNTFVCFSCNARGSPIDFVMKHKNCSFGEAVLYLSNS